MAIRFVDIEPEGEKPKKATAPKPAAARPAERDASEVPAAPELPHAKPEPKPRGRKKPLR